MQNEIIRHDRLCCPVALTGRRTASLVSGPMPGPGSLTDVLARMQDRAARRRPMNFSLVRRARRKTAAQSPPIKAAVALSRCSPQPARVLFRLDSRDCGSRSGLPASRAFYFLPAATWLIADLQPSLRSERADLRQAIFAGRRRASAQRCFTSSLHVFAAAAVEANKSLHGAERSPTCFLTQSAIRP